MQLTISDDIYDSLGKHRKESTPVYIIVNEEDRVLSSWGPVPTFQCPLADTVSNRQVIYYRTKSQALDAIRDMEHCRVMRGNINGSVITVITETRR